MQVSLPTTGVLWGALLTILAYEQRRKEREDALKQKDLPQLPASVPTPEGARDIPYPAFATRGTAGDKVDVRVNHHVVRTLPTKPIWAYDLKIQIPEDSAHKGKAEATFQQRARTLLKNKILEFFGQNYVFDGVCQIWTPDLLFPEGTTRSVRVAMEKRRDGLPNNMDLYLTNKGKLNIRALANYMIKGVIELNPAGNPDLENPIKWLQAVFRKDPASRLVTRPNSNAYFDGGPQTTMALK